MGSEHTNQQFKKWLEDAIEEAKNPDPREALRRKRKQRAKKVERRYGL